MSSIPISSSTLFCPFCSNSFDQDDADLLPYQQLPQAALAFESVVMCPACQGGFALPTYAQEELDKIYTSGEYWGSSARVINYKMYPLQRALAQVRWKQLKSYLRSQASTVLDIGAGQGFLGMLAAADPHVGLKSYIYVEADRAMKQSLERFWVSRFPKCQLQAHASLKDVASQCDMIVLSHILEHVADPCGFLKAVGSRLKSGGHIFVDVPNKEYSYKDSFFPHVNFFEETSLRRTLEAAGFKVVFVKESGLKSEQFRVVNEGLRNKLLYHSRAILPEWISSYFYNRLYQCSHEQSDGIWLRALAVKN